MYLDAVLLQFWVNLWRQALPYTQTDERYQTHMFEGVEDILGRVLASRAPRGPRQPVYQPGQRWVLASWRAMWVLLEFRRLNAARLDELLRWLAQEPNRYHCFVA